MTWSKSEKDNLEKLLTGISANYVPPQEVTFAYPMRHAFINNAQTELFHKLSINKIPTESTLIKGSRRNIGKTLLMRVWWELLTEEIRKVNLARETFLKPNNEWNGMAYYNELSKYTTMFYCERLIWEFYSDITNGEYRFNFDARPRYFFLDDFCYENSFNFNGGKTSQNFINFMRKLLEWLCNNRDRIIVIATTNNNPGKILLQEGQEGSKSSLYSRFDQIFKEENRITI